MARSAGHGFTITFGVVGWAAVIGLPLLHVMPAPQIESLLPIALFVAVILASRVLAFQLVQDRVLSLDSGYYVAAALCVGSIAAGRLVALALTLDAAVRLYLRFRRGKVEPGTWWSELGYILDFGGMSGALIMLWSWLFGADQAVGTHIATVEVTLRVVAIASALLLTHYAIQGVLSCCSGGAGARTCRISRCRAWPPRPR